MMKWLLLIWVTVDVNSASTTGFQTIQFKTKELCIEALDSITKKHSAVFKRPIRTVISGRCVRRW